MNSPAPTAPASGTDLAEQMAKPKINSAALVLIGKSRQILDAAKSAPKIASADQHFARQESFRIAREAARQLETIRLEHTRPIDTMKAAIMAFFKAPSDQLIEAAKLHADEIKAYEDEQKRLAAVEAERLRVAQAAERARQEAEARRVRDEAAAAERAAQEEAQRLEAAGRALDAENARQRAAEQAAEAAQEAMMLETAAETLAAPVVAPPEIRRAAGVSRRETWHAEVDNLRELVQAWIDGKVPQGAIAADMSFLHGQARLQKKTLTYPGVRAVSSSSLGG